MSFAKNLSTDTKLSKSQLAKINQSGGFLVKTLLLTKKRHFY